MNPTLSSFMRTTLANVTVVLGTWLVGLVLVQGARQAADIWFMTPLAILLAAAAGSLVAVRLHTTVALFLILWAAACTASTLAAHVIWGIRAVQGGPTQLTVGAAALLGVVLGVLGVVTLRRKDSQAAGPSALKV